VRRAWRSHLAIIEHVAIEHRRARCCQRVGSDSGGAQQDRTRSSGGGSEAGEARDHLLTAVFILIGVGVRQLVGQKAKLRPPCRRRCLHVPASPVERRAAMELREARTDFFRRSGEGGGIFRRHFDDNKRVLRKGCGECAGLAA
jgi:hypothetical protein